MVNHYTAWNLQKKYFNDYMNIVADAHERVKQINPISDAFKKS